MLLVMMRCSYLPTNFCAYALVSGCGAPLVSPSSVIVGTLITGARLAAPPLRHTCARRQRGRGAIEFN